MTKNNQRAIIIAAGEATRWKNHLGTPKHLVEVDNEPIIHRTVRLLTENGISDIHIVGPIDDRYKTKYSSLFVPVKNEKNMDVDKFLNSESLWNQAGRTIVLYGDVFFTEEAMKTIVHCEQKDWVLFCRFAGSSYSGGIHGECFAQSFYSNSIDKHKEKLLLVAETHRSKKIHRSGGWEHYRAMNDITGSDLKKHNSYKNHIIIDDFTDDFDYPEDYDKFIQRWNAKK